MNLPKRHGQGDAAVAKDAKAVEAFFNFPTADELAQQWQTPVPFYKKVNVEHGRMIISSDREDGGNFVECTHESATTKDATLDILVMHHSAPLRKINAGRDEHSPS